MPKSASWKVTLPWQDGHFQWTLPMQHIPQNRTPCPLIIDRLYLHGPFSGSLCEFNVKVLLRGLYNSDCPLNKLKMDKDGNLRNFTPILENIWEYVTNMNRDWQVLLKWQWKLDIMNLQTVLHDDYTGVHRGPSWWYEQAFDLKLYILWSTLFNVMHATYVSTSWCTYFDHMKIHAIHGVNIDQHIVLLKGKRLKKQSRNPFVRWELMIKQQIQLSNVSTLHTADNEEGMVSDQFCLI